MRSGEREVKEREGGEVKREMKEEVKGGGKGYMRRTSEKQG